MAYANYFHGPFYNTTPNACIVDSTPPTFGGIVSVTPTDSGYFEITWAAGSTTKPRIKYEIFVLPGVVSAATLFSTDDNISKIVLSPALSTIIGILADQTTFFVRGQTYTFGVKAVDALGYQGGPATVISSVAIGSGDIATVFQTVAAALEATELDLAADHIDFQADHANFVADDAAFDADHAAFLADQAAFDADHTNFLADHANFVADLAELEALINLLGAIVGTLEYDSHMTIAINPANDQMELMAWLENQGLIVPTTVQADVDIYDGQGNLLLTLGPSLTPNAQGFFKFTQSGVSQIFNPNFSYLASVRIKYGVTTFSSLRPFTVF